MLYVYIFDTMVREVDGNSQKVKSTVAPSSFITRRAML